MRHNLGHDHDDSPEHTTAFMSEVLGTLAARLGGRVEISEEELNEQRRRYGVPAPLIVARDEGGVFVQLMAIDEMPEKLPAVLERLGGASPEAAKAMAHAMEASFRYAQVIARERGVDVIEARPLTGVEAVARARELVDQHHLGVYGDRTPGWSFRVGKAMHERLEGYMASLPLAGLIEVPRDIEQLLWGYPVVIDPEAEPDTLELRGPMRFTLGDENPAGCTCLGGAYGVHRPPCQYAEAKPFA